MFESLFQELENWKMTTENLQIHATMLKFTTEQLEVMQKATLSELAVDRSS